jgi:hypothetical protein
MQPEFHLSINFSISYNALMSVVKNEKLCSIIWKFKNSNATWDLFVHLLFNNIWYFDVIRKKRETLYNNMKIQEFQRNLSFICPDAFQ